MSRTPTPVLGVLGGSGLYQIDGLSDVTWRKVSSPEARDPALVERLSAVAGRVLRR
jgi:hypothetical protein